MDEYIKVLELAARYELPQTINGNSEVPYHIVDELVQSHFLIAINANSMSGPCYLHPKITVEGREYLKSLKNEKIQNSFWGKTWRIIKPTIGWVGGIIAGLIIAWAAGKFF